MASLGPKALLTHQHTASDKKLGGAKYSHFELPVPPHTPSGILSTGKKCPPAANVAFF